MDAETIFKNIDLDSWQTVLQQVGRLIIAQKNDEFWKLRNAGAKNISFPFWEDDFKVFRETNKAKIIELEKKRLVNKYDKRNIEGEYLDSKISDLQFLQMPLKPDQRNEVLVALAQKGVQVYETEIPLSTDVYFSLQNITIDYHSDNYHDRAQWKLTVKAMARWFKTDLYPASVYLEIDRNIPQWIEEGRELKREFDKIEKIEQINANSIKVLVKNKMRELGCEYRFNEKKAEPFQKPKKTKDYLLEVKLQKGRELAITIPSAKIEKVRTLLDSLSTYIDAINNVPANVRIHYHKVGGGEQWIVEENENR
ncbi:MAG: hypothetical protein IKZ99_08835 [Salinivirgaceae bacterium]|nr:hypothetical protein [Salinivirgaceae bacterium]